MLVVIWILLFKNNNLVSSRAASVLSILIFE